MTTLDKILELLKEKQFHPSGYFDTKKKTKLLEILNPIPDELRNYGVYIFTVQNTNKERVIVYIGKNGTMQKKGVFGNHTLNKRIMQGKVKWISDENFRVYWFVTIKQSDDKVIGENIPSVIESKLLKTFFELENDLPKYNHSF